MKKYEIHNQLTGLSEESSTFEGAKILQDRLLNEYVSHVRNSLFRISVLIQNTDGSWTQGVSDDFGEMIPSLDSSVPNINSSINDILNSL